MPGWLARIDALARRVFAPVAAFSIFVMMAITFAEVIGRYFLGKPLTGAEEVKSFLLGFTVFTALPLVTHGERHIAVRSLANLLKGRAAVLHRLFVRVATAAGFGFVTALLFQQGRSLQQSGMLTDFLDLPVAPPIFFFAALAGVTVVSALALLVKQADAAGPPGPE